MTQHWRTPAPLVSLVVAAAALALFAWLAVPTHRGETMMWDASARDAVSTWDSPSLTSAMRRLTELGSAPFLTAVGLLAAGGLAATGQRRYAGLLAVAALGALVLAQTLKIAFHRARPEAFFGLSAPLD